MKTTAVFLMPLLATIASCGGGAASDVPQQDNGNVAATTPTRALPSDEEIIEKIYNPYYSVPEDFFVDERASTAQSYTVHHVMDESASFELCTDDFSVAQNWEAADNASRSVNGYYVGAYENPRYFEFIRELSYDDDVGDIDDLTSPGFARVFKCSSTDRHGVDRNLLGGYAGTLNSRPLAISTVAEFAEYLWQFTFFPARHKKVLDSYRSGDSTPQHILLLGFASNQGNGRCDRIEVVEWHFSADSHSGEVTADFDTVRSFEAEFSNGRPTICD